MAPRPQATRLADLNPEMVAAVVCVRLARHAEGLRALIAQGPPKRSRTVGSFPIYPSIVGLVRFAKEGDGDLKEVRATLQTLMHDFFTSANDRGSVVSSEPLGAADEVAIVFIAARARVALAAGADVARPGLAALASVHPNRIDSLSGTKGPMVRAGRGLISAASARAWLRAQGVPRF